MSTPSALPENDFLTLQHAVREAGLLQRRAWRFTTKILLAGLLWSIGIAVLFLTQNPWLLLLDAVYLAFVYGQIGLLGHDAGHRQIFNRTVLNDVVGYPCSFLIGMSKQSWIEKHNRHHAHPNREGHDPDIDFPMLAFSEEQLRDKTGWKLWLVRQQGWLFPFWLTLIAVSLRVNGARYLLSHPIKEVWLDLGLYLSHFVLYFSLLFFLLSPLQALLFIVVHQLLFGAYLGMVFAPNHKGMEMIAADAKIDYVREQVLTSRNIKGHPFTDFWYGGLNYQIEHHLFPHMPRLNLRRASTIVREFCQARGIKYHETSWWESTIEIGRSMRSLAQLART